ncbi:MAG: tripartite tricarboxylate transporter substrate binding protein [Thermodesulfobacteriota bacterium]
MRLTMWRVLTVALTVTVLSVFSFSGTVGAAEAYPTKPISIVVPFNAGGAVDVTIRIISEVAEKSLGQKILVVNKPGAGAAEGQGFVARAKADGYTLLAASSSLVTNTLTKKVDFTVDSFAPVILYNFDPEVMFVSASSSAKTIEELINRAKKEPVSHATPGHSTSHHLAALILEKMTGAKFKFVHTKGGAEQVPLVAGGHAECMLGVWGESRGMVEQKKLIPLAVMSSARDSRFPSVPTFKEKGWDINYGAWRGITAPSGTPKEILEKLSQAFKKALESPEVKDKFAKADYTIMVKGPAEFGAYLKKDFENNKSIVELLK